MKSFLLLVAVVAVAGLAAAQSPSPSSRPSVPDIWQSKYQGQWTFGSGDSLDDNGVMAYDGDHNRVSASFDARLPDYNRTAAITTVTYNYDIAYSYLRNLPIICQYDCNYGSCCEGDAVAEELMVPSSSARSPILSFYSSMMARVHHKEAGARATPAPSPPPTTQCNCGTGADNILSAILFCQNTGSTCCNNYGNCGTLYQSKDMAGVSISYCMDGNQPVAMAASTTVPPDDDDELVAFELEFLDFTSYISDASVFNVPRGCAC